MLDNAKVEPWSTTIGPVEVHTIKRENTNRFAPE